MGQQPVEGLGQGDTNKEGNAKEFLLLTWKRRQVRIGDIPPSPEASAAKRPNVGGVQVIPRGQSSLAIVPATGSNQEGMAGAMAAASRREDGQGRSGLVVHATVTTSVVVVEGNETGASSSKGNETPPYVPGWKHIFANTWLENDKKRVEWITNTLLPTESQTYSSLSPSVVTQLSTHIAILISSLRTVFLTFLLYSQY